MASVHKIPKSPFWMLKYVTAEGRPTMRSSKIENTDANRRKALKMAEAVEGAARQARSGELTAAAATKILAGMVKLSSGETLTDPTARSFLNGWVEGQTRKSTAETIIHYRPFIASFLNHLGKRAEKSLRGITESDVDSFRRSLLSSGKSHTTVNKSVQVLRAALGAALIRGMIPVNPAALLPTLDSDAKTREPFTLEEIRKLLAAADDDWRGVLLLGCAAGLRLSDAAGLQWSAIDLKEGTLTVMPAKTKRKKVTLIIALHLDLKQWLQDRRAVTGSNMEGPIFPALATMKTSGGRGLSATFRTIMRRAGVAGKVTREARAGGRISYSKGFHSTRHTFVSLLLNNGISADVRMSLSGHSSAASHQKYSHLQIETQRRAIEGLPSLLADS